MPSFNKSFVAAVVAGAMLAPGSGLAQSSTTPAQAPPSGGATPAGSTMPADQVLKPEQLEQLVSPIALYSDALLAQVLMASTYPLEVVEASRWVTEHKTLKGTALKDAIDKEKWDDSVKGLMATPQVLDMMSGKLSWTKDLGDAVLAQQNDVMDAVQRLRARADANKKLETTKEQKVTKKSENNKQVIVIESATPDTVYVPYYNPAVVYGAWPYPAYPPYYYPPPYGYYPVLGTGMAFAAGVAIGAWAGRYWGGGVGWGNNTININNNFNRATQWNHNPSHRQGVRYNNSNVAKQYGRGDAGRGNDFRGRDGNRPGGGDRPGAGNRPGGGDRPGAGNRPGGGGDRPGAGNRPGGGGDRPGAGNRPGGGGGPSAGNRPSGGNRPSAGQRPSSGQRPSGGQRPGGGGGRDNAFSGGGGGRNAASQSARGHASMGGRGGGSFQGGGGGGGRSFSGGGGRGGGGGGGRGGGGGGRRSDVTLKHDITLLGYLDSGIGFYRFSYNGSDKPYVGVMAQEVQLISPDAVTRGADGYLRVYYEKLGVTFQTYQQWVGSGGLIPAVHTPSMTRGVQ